jgi:hypothetical protein
MIVYQCLLIDDWPTWQPYAPDELFAEICRLAAMLGWQGDIATGPLTKMVTDDVQAIGFEDNTGIAYAACSSDTVSLFDQYPGSRRMCLDPAAAFPIVPWGRPLHIIKG